MENINLSPLHPYLITKTDADALGKLLGSTQDALFKENFTLREFLARNTSFEISGAIEKLVREKGIDPADKKALQTFFNKLQKVLAALPVIHVMLAFLPKEKLITVIHDWFYQKFQRTVLLDISVDPEIIAGCVISFGGRANDYSLKNQIDQMSGI